jgi:NAD(P)-dependent dehydrogenase (short-subunit alcohol dehydrogenase family)
LVTGSTSGIGLGIARALAAAGSGVVLNGFGKPEEIKAALDAGSREGANLPVVIGHTDTRDWPRITIRFAPFRGSGH